MTRAILALAGVTTALGGGCVEFFDLVDLPEGVAIVDVTGGPSPGEPGAPLFTQVATYSTTIAADGDPAEVYFPHPPDLIPGSYSFPIALLLQGVNVHRSHYSTFAEHVASYGFVVVVPNHRGYLGLGLFVNLGQLDDVLDFVAAEDADPASPLFGIVDPDALVLLAHSFGGAAALQAVQGDCLLPYCFGQFARPGALRGVAVYGTDLKDPFGGPIPPINNAGLAVLVVCGSRDGIADPAPARRTYDQIRDAPKALVTVLGANHYGIANCNNPLLAPPERSSPTLAQEIAVETVARWCALFLRGHVLGDPAALEYVQSTGDGFDENVSVISEP